MSYLERVIKKYTDGPIGELPKLPKAPLSVMSVPGVAPVNKSDPVITLRERLPLLPDDVKFIRRRLFVLGAYLGPAEAICLEYETRWRDAADKELLPHRKDNAGRRAANEWLRDLAHA